MRKTEDHTHKYERMTWPNGRAFYKCMESNCSHFLPSLPLVIGRESKCWGELCDSLVVITREDVNKGLKRPMCEDCKKKRKEQREELMKI